MSDDDRILAARGFPRGGPGDPGDPGDPGNGDSLDGAAALAALGLASPDEEAALDRAGAEGLRLRRAYADAAAVLAFSLPALTPPPWSRLEAALPARDGAPPRLPAAVIPLRPRRTAWLATGAALAAAAALALLWQRSAHDADAARRELAAVRERSAFAIAEVEARYRREAATLHTGYAAYEARMRTLGSPSIELATVKGPAGTAKVFVDPERRRWLVLAFELPAQADKDYQLWFVPETGAPVSAGLLQLGPDGVLGATPELPAHLQHVRPAISLEPRGGSPAPTDVKLVGDLI